jgi:hypothetical protein
VSIERISLIDFLDLPLLILATGKNWEDFIKDEMERFDDPYDSSHYMLIFCNVSIEDEYGNCYTGDELRIQSGRLNVDGDFEEHYGTIYTDVICSENSKFDLPSTIDL